MVLYGPIVTLTVLYGPLWSLMVSYGPLWSCMVLYSLVWSLMAQHGPIWSHMYLMVLYVPVWYIWSHMYHIWVGSRFQEQVSNLNSWYQLSWVHNILMSWHQLFMSWYPHLESWYPFLMRVGSNFKSWYPISRVSVTLNFTTTLTVTNYSFNLEELATKFSGETLLLLVPSF